ncbi:DUF2207 family protein [Desulfurobacterium atlanticum]|uniref:Uncharacterized membrane protein n=1 Tax=Desulfurobacterium atlanticum TaxID=240169 RepID=A0A238YVK9_9BACT|nr:DUF2207 domain-containing protein [Desulfurobacterium atlanticum]SNR74972.1 Uncharacterized membrane protein [Desulfurobacterium atlanticum]
MEEKKRFFISVVISFFLIFLNFIDLRLLFSPLTADYTAVLTINKTVSLQETFDFNVRKGGKYSMLFRNWKVPLVFLKEEVEFPFISLQSLKSEGLWYVVDYKHRVYLKISDKTVADYCKNRAFDNEIGIVNTDLKKFSKGNYSLSAFYSIFPPVESDGKYTHINLKLADSHIFYPKVKIFIKDPESFIKKLYVHMVDYTIEETADGYFISGTSPDNSLVEVEMILKNRVAGFYRKVSDVVSLAESSNRNFSLLFLKGMDKLLFLFSLLFPFGMVVYYWYFGREFSTTIPEFVSFIPDKGKKPYLVNLLFSGDATSCDENGFYATLLDLKRRGFIDLAEKDGKVVVKVLSGRTEDPYEKAVLSFLTDFSEKINDSRILDFENLNKKIQDLIDKKDISTLRKIKSRFDAILGWKDGLLIYNYLDLKGYTVFKTVAVFVMAFLLFFVVINLILANPLIDIYKVLVHCGILFFQLLIFLILPPQVLGRWKEDRYREKLLWEGFKNFLSNFVMMKKYAPSDISIWKEWLVYATALGVADKVEKVMEELKVSIPEIREERILRTGFGGLYYGIGRGISSLSANSSGGGGSFGAGGGFGGGGAGGR